MEFWSVQNKTSFVSFLFMFLSGNKNKIQNKRENIFSLTLGKGGLDFSNILGGVDSQKSSNKAKSSKQAASSRPAPAPAPASPPK